MDILQIFSETSSDRCFFPEIQWISSNPDKRIGSDQQIKDFADLGAINLNDLTQFKGCNLQECLNFYSFKDKGSMKLCV